MSFLLSKYNLISPSSHYQTNHFLVVCDFFALSQYTLRFTYYVTVDCLRPFWAASHPQDNFPFFLQFGLNVTYSSPSYVGNIFWEAQLLRIPLWFTVINYHWGNSKSFSWRDVNSLDIILICFLYLIYIFVFLTIPGSSDNVSHYHGRYSTSLLMSSLTMMASDLC